MEPVTSLSPIHDKYDAQWEPYREKICEIIGTNKILENENNGDFYLGNILAEIQTLITGAQISIFNTKLLSDTWNPGKLPKYKIKNMINFESNLCTFTMTGREVLKMMSILQSGDDKYYSTNGIKQIMTKDESNNYILTQVKLFDGYKEEEIDDNRDYLISANSFLTGGKDEFEMIYKFYKPRNLKCDFGLEKDINTKYLKENKNIDVRKYMDENNPIIRFIYKTTNKYVIKKSILYK
jgi:2',3'-cyclic-nucleotide 2'-phosphodiesterase (5'-nucleotidase family)